MGDFQQKHDGTTTHSGIFAQNFIQIYTNPHMGMFGVFKEAERIKELEFVVKLRCFSAKIE